MLDAQEIGDPRVAFFSHIPNSATGRFLLWFLVLFAATQDKHSNRTDR